MYATPFSRSAIEAWNVKSRVLSDDIAIVEESYILHNTH